MTESEADAMYYTPQQARSNLNGEKYWVIDTSGWKSFGYGYAVMVETSKDENGDPVEKSVCKSVSLWLVDAKNAGGGTGGVSERFLKSEIDALAE